MKKNKKLLDEYRFSGFRPLMTIKGKFGDHKARIIHLTRRQKKLFVVVAEASIAVSMTIKPKLSEIYLAVTPGFIWHSRFAGLNV